jgi:hypothetical protein
MATAVWPMLVPSASAATTRCAGANAVRIRLPAIVTTPLPDNANPASLYRPRASIARERLAITQAPTSPGANSTNPAISSGT